MLLRGASNEAQRFWPENTSQTCYFVGKQNQPQDASQNDILKVNPVQMAKPDVRKAETPSHVESNEKQHSTRSRHRNNLSNMNGTHGAQSLQTGLSVTKGLMAQAVTPFTFVALLDLILWRDFQCPVGPESSSCAFILHSHNLTGTLCLLKPILSKLCLMNVSVTPTCTSFLDLVFTLPKYSCGWGGVVGLRSSGGLCMFSASLALTMSLVWRRGHFGGYSRDCDWEGGSIQATTVGEEFGQTPSRPRRSQPSRSTRRWPVTQTWSFSLLILPKTLVKAWRSSRWGRL